MTTDTRAPISSPPGIAGWWERRSTREKWLLAAGIVSIFVLLPLRGLFRRQGPPMEEGFMLVFAERVLAGDVPNVDFLHLYGPGSLWVLAGVFKVFGVSLWAERIVALLQQLGIIFGVFFLARSWGRTAATLAASITAVIVLPPTGLAALAWNGGLALGLWGVGLALEGRRRAGTGAGTVLAVAGGVLLGLAVLYRQDLVLAVALALAVLCWGAPRPVIGKLLAGAAVGVAPYLIHVAMAGIGDAVNGLIVEPIFDLRGGRSLPVPPTWQRVDGFLNDRGDLDAIDWPFPRLWSGAQLTIWFATLFLSVLTLVLVGLWRRRANPTSCTALTLVAVAAFCVGLLPQALQRADNTHLAWTTCVPFGFLTIAFIEILRNRQPDWQPRVRALLAGGSILAFLLVVIPNFTARDYTDVAAQTFDVHRRSYDISYRGRDFFYGRPDVPPALAELLPEANRISKPGDRLFVGTSDLRKTPYSDAFLYYLLPELEPATYYIEMDPGVANAPDSGLAEELASADIVILSSVWDPWEEPNDSEDFGPDAPNRVLQEQFCLVGEYGGLYRLFERCDK